jgi:hypothetical protein
MVVTNFKAYTLPLILISLSIKPGLGWVLDRIEPNIVFSSFLYTTSLMGFKPIKPQGFKLPSV